MRQRAGGLTAIDGLRAERMSAFRESFLSHKYQTPCPRHLSRCKAKGCAGRCTGRNCGNSCSKLNCAHKCTGVSCANGCSGPSCAGKCKGEQCGLKCEGEKCGIKCTGKSLIKRPALFDGLCYTYACLWSHIKELNGHHCV